MAKSLTNSRTVINLSFYSLSSNEKSMLFKCLNSLLLKNKTKKRSLLLLILQRFDKKVSKFFSSLIPLPNSGKILDCSAIIFKINILLDNNCYILKHDFVFKIENLTTSRVHTSSIPSETPRNLVQRKNINLRFLLNTIDNLIASA